MGQKANSQISQEQEEIPDGQHDSNSLNNSQDGDVEITNHQKGTQSIKSVPADKLMNGHKCTTANLQSQTEEEEKTTGSFESTKLAATIQSVSSAVTSPSNPPCTSSSLPIDPKSTLVSLEERLATCGLPEAVEDAEFDNKLKVFTNYRNFGAMYQSKNNFKKAEWAFKNGIKQAVGGEALRSKEQLRAVIGAELEFRLERAKALMRLGQQSEAKVECSTVLIIDSSNTEAPSLLSSIS